MMVTGASTPPSPSRTAPANADGTPLVAFSSLTSSRTRQTLRAFDAQAFPVAGAAPASKRRKVADVQADAGSDSAASAAGGPPGVLFSRLTGLGRRQKERKRYEAQAARAALAARPSGGSQLGNIVETVAEDAYTPFSLPDLLSRLGTFTLTSYSLKSPPMSPLSAALHGWQCTGRTNVLTCKACGASWTVDAGVDLTAMKEKHAEPCPWRVRQCHPSLYRVPLLPHSAMITSLIGESALVAPAVVDMTVESPLSEAESGNLRMLVLRAALREPLHASTTSIDGRPPSRRSIPPQAPLVSLFGWTVASSPRDRTILECKFCRRRVGAWTFATLEDVRGHDSVPSSPSSSVSSSFRRPFHVANEHREFCPIVNGAVQAGVWLETGSSDISVTSATTSSGSPPGWQLLANIALRSGSRRDEGGAEPTGSDGKVRRREDVLNKVRRAIRGGP